MRTIHISKDGDGFFYAYFSDDPDTRTGSFETPREAIGELVIEHANVFDIEIEEVG